MNEYVRLSSVTVSTDGLKLFTLGYSSYDPKLLYNISFPKNNPRYYGVCWSFHVLEERVLPQNRFEGTVLEK